MIRIVGIIFCSIIVIVLVVCGRHLGTTAVKEGGDGGLGGFILAFVCFALAFIVAIPDVILIMRALHK